MRAQDGSRGRAGALEQCRGRGSSPNEQRQPRHFPQRHTKTAAAIAGHQGTGTCPLCVPSRYALCLMKRIISFTPTKEVRAPHNLSFVLGQPFSLPLSLSLYFFLPAAWTLR